MYSLATLCCWNNAEQSNEQLNVAESELLTQIKGYFIDSLIHVSYLCQSLIVLKMCCIGAQSYLGNTISHGERLYMLLSF